MRHFRRALSGRNRFELNYPQTMGVELSQQSLVELRNDDRFNAQKAGLGRRLRSLPEEGRNAKSEIHGPLPSFGTDPSHD